MRKSFVREKRVEAGPYKHISIYARTLNQELKCKEKGRVRKRPISRPGQLSWNNKKSRKYAAWLIYENFGKDDYYLTFTYSNEQLPKTPDDAIKHQRNTLDKLNRLYKKNDKELKYIWFTSYQFNDDTGYIKRIHHHAIINGGVNRDDVESCWSIGRKRVPLGRTQARLVQPGINGLQELANYLTNQEQWENRQWKKSKKRWSRSRNLKKPTETINDSYWSIRKLEKVGLSTDAGEEILLKRFPNHRLLSEPKIKHIKESGWYIEVELLKFEPG